MKHLHKYTRRNERREQKVHYTLKWFIWAISVISFVIVAGVTLVANNWQIHPYAFTALIGLSALVIFILVD